jgi:hypothetical protein
MWYSLFMEVQRTAGVSTTDLVGRMLLMTRQHFRQGPLEYDVGHEGSSQLGLDSDARSPYTGCSQFLPTTQKIIQFSDGKPPKVPQIELTSDILVLCMSWEYEELESSMIHLTLEAADEFTSGKRWMCWCVCGLRNDAFSMWIVSNEWMVDEQ